MEIRSVVLAVGLTVLCALVPASAGARQAGFQIYGLGLDSCGKWTQEHRAESDWANAQSSWLTGWVSGIGYATNGRLRHVDGAGIVAFVDSYCAAHPLERVADAAKALVGELLAK